MKFDEAPADVEWNEWGPPVRVEIEHAPGFFQIVHADANLGLAFRSGKK